MKTKADLEREFQKASDAVIQADIALSDAEQVAYDAWYALMEYKERSAE